MKKDIVIPFDGFYHSIHEHNIDRILEHDLSDSSGEGISNLINANNDINYSAVFKEYAKEYVSAFASHFDLETLEYKELVSPKFYNFSTDRIFCTIELSEIKNIYTKVNQEKLIQKITDKFTSYDGFRSFYSNSLSTWWKKSFDTWDHNELGTILEAYLEAHDEYTEDYQLDITQDFELWDLLYDNSGDEYKRLVNIAHYLRIREERLY